STTGKSDPPDTDTERALAEVFAELLSTSEIGRFDDFFALGGDSILSVQLAARARAAGLAVSPRMVFENPTVQLLAAAVEAAPARNDTGHRPDEQHEPMSMSGLSADDLAAAAASWTSRDGKS
ncbi:MAG TPA: phosphopantetheine-binding protein, partial [Mycobacterium sp.]|nr:phosphopantetheine-binding protein [Mycobacterium sp.]